MKIVVDVGVGKAVERWLASQNLDVVAVRDLDPGMADIAILALAAAEQRLVITMDKDFGELIVRSGQLHAGVLLLRLADADSQEKLRVVQQIFALHRNALPGNYCIYHKDKLRIRQLP
jgi:predicted nuclease of predicted toxin-antitoxin system